MSLQNTAQWLTDRAVANHKAGQLEEAIAYYLELIELDDNQPAWVYGNAISLLAKVDDFGEDIDLEPKAIAIHPQSDEVYRALGILYEKQASSLDCINFYQRAISLEPQQPDWLYCNLAKQLLQSNRLEEAEKAADRGTQLYPNFHALHYILGNVLIELEQWSQAIACYRKVQQLNPGWEEVQQKLNQAVYRKSQAERLIHHQHSQTQSTALKVEVPQLSSNLTTRASDLDYIFARLQKHQLSILDCHQIWQNFTGSEIKLDYGCWLSPNMLYLEARVDNYWVQDRATILACSNSQYAVTAANFWQISEQQIAGIACFNDNLHGDRDRSYHLCINHNNNAVFVVGEVSQTAYSLEFIDYLKTKSNKQQHLIRESVSDSIIKLVAPSFKSEAGEFLQKLQCFLAIPPSNYVDPNLPFKIWLDYIVPLESDGLFISGWLQDPYEMLEGITAISALGFSLELSNRDIHRFDRHDVNQFLQDTRYGEFEEKLGFCAYIPVPQAIHQAIAGFAKLHSFRFLIKLKGNVEIEIIPDAKYSDYYNARQRVMQIASLDKVSEAMLANCIAPAGLKLQQLCVERVEIESTIAIGTPVEQPLVSIIIPLYRRLDFLKVQLATMANDPAIKQCEIIYVLDSPEQQEELKTFLLNHCTLYQLPVRLVVMKRNSGYATANNAGASQATGKYLVLLNSDVFAKTKGWVLKMAEFYAATPKVGALGAKLLYEDGSLQHAGMFFAQTTFPFWLTLHYYKGLPGNYAPAQKTRSVPAVTGACLMIDRKLYQEVGGLTADYVIGDFEDSDLCFKCRELGYESWYFADAVLYHLERQSVPLNSVYNGSLAWQLNGRLHHKRWEKTISELMNIYQ